MRARHSVAQRQSAPIIGTTPGDPVIPAESYIGIDDIVLRRKERAYIAASRRESRPMEIRLHSAKSASEVHKARTGRPLIVTEEIIAEGHAYMEGEDEEIVKARKKTAEKSKERAKRYEELNKKFERTFPYLIDGCKPRGVLGEARLRAPLMNRSYGSAPTMLSQPSDAGETASLPMQQSATPPIAASQNASPSALGQIVLPFPSFEMNQDHNTQAMMAFAASIAANQMSLPSTMPNMPQHPLSYSSPTHPATGGMAQFDPSQPMPEMATKTAAYPPQARMVPSQVRPMYGCLPHATASGSMLAVSPGSQSYPYNTVSDVSSSGPEPIPTPVAASFSAPEFAPEFVPKCTAGSAPCAPSAPSAPGPVPYTTGLLTPVSTPGSASGSIPFYGPLSVPLSASAPPPGPPGPPSGPTFVPGPASVVAPFSGPVTAPLQDPIIVLDHSYAFSSLCPDYNGPIPDFTGPLGPDLQHGADFASTTGNPTTGPFFSQGNNPHQTRPLRSLDRNVVGA